MTNQTMIYSARRLRDSNIKCAWLLHGQSKTCYKIKSVKNWVSILKVEVEAYIGYIK